MKTHVRILSLVLVGVLMLMSAPVSFAAEEAYSYCEEEFQEKGEIFEITDSIDPLSQGDEVSFDLGNSGYISNCGFTPKFKMWVTGGTSSTQITFNITTAGGVNYTQGPVKADGSSWVEKQYYVYNGGGTWKFTAHVSGGTNPGGLVCHVRQIY